MTTILVPFHQDGRLPKGCIPLPNDQDVVVVDPILAPAIYGAGWWSCTGRWPRWSPINWPSRS